MSPDKPNIHPFDCKFDDYDKTVVISPNVKYIMLIADIIDTVETLLNISKTFPVRLFYCLHPILQGYLGVRESDDVIF